MKSYNIMFDEKITSYYFYKVIIPELNNYIVNYGNEQLILDFSEVEFINPIVVPKICALGLIIRNNFRNKALLYIPWKPKLLSYLHDIGFLDIIRTYDLFDLDERYIGGYNVGGMYPECRTIALEKGYSDLSIRNELVKSIHIIEKIYSGAKNFKISTIDKILEVLTQLCHNGCTHGESACFATLQTNLIDKTNFKKAFISISDCGIGYNNSFRKKDNCTFKFLNKNKDSNEIKEFTDIDSILEAVFYRYDENVYGIYHVFENIIESSGTIRMHCGDIQLIFTERTIKNIRKPIKNKEWIVVSNYFKNMYRTYYCNKDTMQDDRYSSIRKYSNISLKGVHIEIEIPI